VITLVIPEAAYTFDESSRWIWRATKRKAQFVYLRLPSKIRGAVTIRWVNRWWCIIYGHSMP